ncbi:MAG: ATP-binding protein [Thermosynechococcaceae cyanobacterium MS004]|nr:ATP-binding protein [Thermosynechococcaceae cyanobacterium MS004]
MMPDLSYSRDLFERLKAAILDLGHPLLAEGVVLTEEAFRGVNPDMTPFVLVVAPEFRGLLHAQETTEPLSLPTLTLETPRITAFLKTLRSLAIHQPTLSAQVKLAQTIHSRPISVASIYPGLVQHLFNALTQAVQSLQSQPTAMSCQPIVAAALHQQGQQERLLEQVTTQIRESLELPTLLQTAVSKVCKFLEADRLLIYQFENQFEASSPELPVLQGSVIYESCAHEAIPSLLGQEVFWALTAKQCRRYAQGQTLATAQVKKAADLLDGTLDLLYQGNVRSQLITPILVQNQLWGLLISHQCSPREWEARDVKFLEQIAEHLAIAIYQAQLFQQVQIQKQTLEQQVVQRTQDLRDALVETQSANRVKSDFLATMSHELRTPLTCVIGMSATLIRWSLGPLNDKQRGYLQTIHDSGEHLLELINDILELSYAESGKATLNLSEFSLNALAHQSVQMLRDKAEEGEIDLRVNVKVPQGQDNFVADSRRVKQILFNLLSNAIKFTPPEGTVTLRVWVEPNTAIFQVEDTGIGIAASQQPRLFQKFQQLDTSYRRTYEGTGLGLALTKQFIDLHRGWIEVESEEGQGTIFTVELPNQALLESHQDLLRSQYVTTSSNRIVLLEENEENATLICEMLTAAGYHVIWIVEDSTARDQIRFLQPSAVIISTDHEESHSLKLIQQFRKFSESLNLKIVALGPHEAAKDPQPYLLAGADTFLHKPVNPEHLVHKVDILLSSPATTAQGTPHSSASSSPSANLPAAVSPSRRKRS